MVSSVEIILIPTIMIGLGYFLKRLGVLKESDSTLLSKLVINIFLPALIFSNLSVATISSDMLILPFISIIFCFICMFIAFIYCKSRGYSKVKTWTIIVAVSMMNTAFVGYPVILGVYGNSGFLRAVFYDMSVAIFFVVMGMILVGVFGGNRRDVIKNGVTFVPLWAVILGILFNVFNIHLGYVMTNVLDYLGDATIPLIMLSLGLTINLRRINDYLEDTFFVTVVRLLVAPCIMFFCLVLLHVDGLSRNVAILQSAMPTAMNALVLAITYELDVEFMSSLIFITTILCLFTLPVIIYVV